MPGTGWVTAIGTAPGPEVFTPFFRYAFATGVLAVLFPVLILISTATRLAAARREERFAALRLVGATSGDISVIASVDAVVTALLGAVAGTGLFLAVQPALAAPTLTGTRYFASTVNPTDLGVPGADRRGAAGIGDRVAAVAAPGADFPARRDQASHSAAAFGLAGGPLAAGMALYHRRRADHQHQGHRRRHCTPACW